MRKERIGLVLSNVPGYSETFFRNKIKGLQKNGYDVILFINENQSEPPKFLCDIIAAPNLKTNTIRRLLSLIKLVVKACFINPKQSYRLYTLDKKDGLPFKTRIKQVLINQFLLSQKVEWLHFGFGMLAVGRENVAQAIGSKMAVSFRGFDLYLSPLKHKNCYDTLFSKNIKYHVLSQEMKQDLINYKVPKERIRVITPAIDVGFFEPNTETNKGEVVKILTVARLHWKKGLEYTLEALYLLKKDGIKFHYTIIGDGIELERLMFTAYQLNIMDQVTFKGKLPHDEVKKEMEQSQIYLQFSIQEGFCNAVLEAQAMGLMCIVSDAEGLSENVLHNKTGWVASKRNTKSLKNTIKQVVEMSNEDQQHIRETAMRRVKNEFHILQQQQDFVSFYSV
jgi:colanic acid/amylovoran biosynthesis glycosyltransferase